MRRDTLTRDRIVRTAIDLLDDHGLEGFNMRTLGRRLGSAATAVYWHVQSKPNLIRLAGDQVWNEIDLPDLSAVDWRTAAATMARGLHGMLIRHPWLVTAFSAEFLYGPAKARYDDHNLAVYEKAGFGAAQADRASATVFMFVLGNALGNSATVSLSRRLTREGKDAEERFRETMEKAIDIGMRFPRLRARVEEGAEIGYATAPEHSFEFGLKVILDGLERELASPETAVRYGTGRNRPGGGST